MLVECIGNTINDIPDESGKKAYRQYIHLDRVCLEIGRIYQVFGVCFWDDKSIPWYLVCEEEDDEYPLAKLGRFFKVIDGSIPPDWCFRPIPGNVGVCSFLPKPWANDHSFMEKLVDEDKSALAYFRNLKTQYGLLSGRSD